MKFILAFILFLPITSMAFFSSSSHRPSPCKYCNAHLTFEKEGVLCKRAYGPNKEFYSKVFESHSMEAKYCERMYPRSIEQVFQEGFDIPAHKLNITEKQITNTFYLQFNQFDDNKVIVTPEYTNNAPIKVDKNTSIKTGIAIYPFDKEVISHRELKSSAPWDFILDLNIQAAQIWQEMLTCSGGDPEKARRNYFLANWDCGKDLQKKLNQLHDNIFMMLITSDVKSSNASTLMSVVHPLYAQILLEHYAIITRHPDINGDEALPYKVTVEVEAVQNNYDNLEIDSVMYIQKKTFKVDIHNANSVQRGKALVNLFNLLELLPRKCEAFGLWPGAARPLIASYDDVFTVSELDIRHIKNKLFLACGPSHPMIYYNYLNIYEDLGSSIKIYKTYREIYNRY